MAHRRRLGVGFWGGGENIFLVFLQNVSELPFLDQNFQFYDLFSLTTSVQIPPLFAKSLTNVYISPIFSQNLCCTIVYRVYSVTISAQGHTILPCPLRTITTLSPEFCTTNC